MTHYHRLVLVPLAGVLVGCGAHARPALAPAPLAPLPVTTVSSATAGTEVQIAPDHTAEVILKVENEFAAGQRELNAGRLVAARDHFDAAVDMMLALPEGARSTPRLAAAFDQLLDRISALDVLALREGDGFTETRTEPAAIDELLTAATFDRPKPAATTRETVEADLARGNFDLEIPANEKVLSYVELFQGRLHDFMEAGLSRSLRYLPMIQDVFRKEGLPADLAYVPLVESAFKVTALSRVKARGLWQFMPGTGREHGLDQTWFVDERSDPEKATLAAATYLKTLRAFFDGDWNLALASYNAGPGRLQGAIRRAKTSDFWTLTSSSKYLPRETREYVPMIMAATIIAKNPTLYGFNVGAASPLAYDSVTVPNALDLKIIAEWIDCSVDDLRELNPELRRTTTPATDHELKVPLGTAATVKAKLASIDPSLYVRFNFHTVRRGETVASIARKYHITQSDLRLANDLSARAKVTVNQALMIPQRSATGLPTATATRAAAPATVASTRSSAAPARVASSSRASASSPLTYRVQRGDTLYSIAKRFDTTVDVLRRINRISGTKITVGARLTVRQ
jgi:membrane-bound lytic murein transglycosylase D